MEFLEEAWYVAGWGDELRSDALLSRTLLDQPLVLFRDAQGQAHALRDRCPHRFAPLSLGDLVAGARRVDAHGNESANGCAPRP